MIFLRILAFTALLSMLSCSDDIDPAGNNNGPGLTVDANGFTVITSQFSGLDVFAKYKVNGSNLEAIVDCPTTGWAALGFNSSAQMGGANVIIGYNNGTANIQDSTATASPRGVTADAINNIISSDVTDDGNRTVLSFTIPLDSGDAADIVLTTGNSYSLLVACGTADNYTIAHAASHRMVVSITL